MKKTIRVSLIEGNRLAREELAALLGSQPDLQVVAVSATVDGWLSRAQETKPAIVLVNASLRNAGSCRFVASVLGVAPEVKVIVLDLQPVEQDVVAFVKAGVAGFVAKNATIAELTATPRSVANDEKVVPQAFTRALVSYVASGRARHGASDVQQVSRREGEIMVLIEEGMDNKEIARRLDIGAPTVKTHVRSILEKLGLRNRLEISAYVHRALQRLSKRRDTQDHEAGPRAAPTPPR